MELMVWLPTSVKRPNDLSTVTARITQQPNIPYGKSSAELHVIISSCQVFAFVFHFQHGHYKLTNDKRSDNISD